MAIRGSPQAARQLESIRDFIARDSVSRATQFTECLATAVRRLEQFPQSGAIAGRKRNCRQIVFRRYRIVYRVKSDRVEIVAVLALGKLSFLTDPPQAAAQT